MCSGDTYEAITNYCVVGLILYGLGIPTFLFYEVRNCTSPLWIQASKILYNDYTENWLYFEIYNSARKLLLTSIAVYIAPRTSGQSLFLLTVGAVNFVIIFAYQPYKDIYDTYMAVVFAFLEMFFFFTMLVDKSNIASEAGLSVASMENFLATAIIFSLAFLVPFSLAMKIPFSKEYILKFRNRIEEIIDYNLQPKMILESNVSCTDAFTSSLTEDKLSKTEFLALETKRVSSENLQSISKLKNNGQQTTFILTSLNVGVGLYNFPKVLSNAGVIGGILILAIVMWMVRIALNHLAEVAEVTGVMDLLLLCEAMFGDNGKKIFSFLLVFDGLFVLVVFITLSASTFSRLLSSWGCSSGACSFYSVITIIMVTIESRMCFRRYLAENYLYSAFAVFALAFATFFIVIGGPMNSSSHEAEGTNIFSGTGFVKSFGSVIFAAGFNFSAILQVYSAMGKRNAVSWGKAVSRTQFFAFCVFITVGLAGYLSFKNTTEDYVIDNFGQAAGEALSFILAVQMLLQIPQVFIVLRLNTTILFSLPRELPNLYHFFLCSLILVLATAISVILSYTEESRGKVFSSIINFLGCITYSITSFVIPAILHIKIFGSNDKRYIHNVFLVIFGIFTLVVFPVGLSI
jgi:amino acid permease